MTLARTLQEAAGNGISTGEVAEAIDFDGTNDYLSRGSDLTGNADGKTFTFSAFGYFDGNGTFLNLGAAFGQGFYIYVSSTAVFCTAFNASNTKILGFNTNISGLARNTWLSFQVSIDLTNSANKHVYVNDIDVTSGVTWDAYTNDTINFTNTVAKVGDNAAGNGKMDGRLSNVYLDYTYRDLSIESNRRLFVTADLKPAADQAALSPIMYLPMDDPTQPGLNLGTGGDFTLTGTIARSGRGPNQYNAPYSDLDGTADYLFKTSGLTVPSSKVFTMQVVLRPTTPNSTADDFFYIRSASASVFNLRYFTYGGSSNGFYLEILNATSNYIFEGYIAPFSTSNQNRNYVLTFSIDMDNQSNCRAYLNGEAKTMSLTTFVAGQASRLGDRFSVGVSTDFVGNFYNWYSGSIGALWFNTSYIDLSVADNLAKFVTGTGIDAKPVDLGATGELPTGTSPLIYLPMYGNNAGKNYGTGGDFTVSSGPYTGARGPNEFWGNKADFDGSTGYLARTSALTGVSDGKTFSFSFFINRDTTAASRRVFDISVPSGSARLGIATFGTDQLNITGFSAIDTYVLDVRINTVQSIGTTYHVCGNIDMANTSNRSIYVNNVLDSSTWASYSNENIIFTQTSIMVGARWNGSFFDGKLSEFYFTTDYIDFSQEANRLKFRDAFGNPVDLTQQIANGSIPNPAIYMRFDPASFGTNSGTGGAFTVNGTITDGGQL